MANRRDPILSQFIKAFRPPIPTPSSPVLYYNPLVDPINFIRRPLGTSVRSLLRTSLSNALDSIAYASLLAEKYPTLLTPSDVDLLNELFFSLNRITILSSPPS